MKNKLLFLVVLVALCRPSLAQILSVSSPITGAVYQQNQQGRGKVVVLGDYNSIRFFFQNIVSVSASLQKLNLTTGTPTGEAPIPISISKTNSTFSGEIIVSKGWYELSVKTALFGVFTLREDKRKVGVGEVFIIAGQSNAQGLPNSVATGPGAYPNGASSPSWDGVPRRATFSRRRPSCTMLRTTVLTC